jgi:L-asparaginase/Glu-tRNA(Gln) amidotransferase subunit D
VISAAATVGEAVTTPLSDELEEILGAFASLVKPAQKAVTVVVASLMGDPESTDAERNLATALLVLATASQ